MLHSVGAYRATNPNNEEHPEKPEDRTIVVAHHIPFVSFIDQSTLPHQTDNVSELYELIGDRKALSLSGHTHTIGNLAPGDVFDGWDDIVGISALPFRHLIAGAVSGGWWNGDYDVHGVPMSLQRQGGPRGWVEMTFSDGDYTLDYRGTGLPDEEAMWLSISTPPFRAWAGQIMAWMSESRDSRDPVPPLSVLDLPDVRILTPEDLEGGSWLTANIWMGDSTTEALVSLNGAQPAPMIRTQQARGEAANVGVDWADPFALQRQLTVARGAIVSRSGDPMAQGYKQGRYSSDDPGVPQPRGSLADRNVHLWRFELPSDLPEGVHTAEIVVTRDQGETSRNVLVFEVRSERPRRQWRSDVWNAVEDGPPVR